MLSEDVADYARGGFGSEPLVEGGHEEHQNGEHRDDDREDDRKLLKLLFTAGLLAAAADCGSLGTESAAEAGVLGILRENYDHEEHSRDEQEEIYYDFKNIHGCFLSKIQLQKSLYHHARFNAIAKAVYFGFLGRVLLPFWLT
jgi:hypothetical protein